MHPAISTAPRFSARELTMMETMDAFYAGKATAQLGEFLTDGFCLVDAGMEHSAAAPPARPPKTSIILCSRAFARIVDRPATSLLRADLHGLLEPAVASTGPEVAESLLNAMARREPYHAVFEAHMPHHAAGAGGDGALGAAEPDGGAAKRPPGRVYVIDVSPFVFERRVYFSVILSDLSDDLVMHNADLDGFRPPTGALGDLSATASPRGVKRPTPKGPSSDWAKATRRISVGRGGRASPSELADRFVHCVPSSWRWFGCKTLQKVITAALHAANVALSLSDLRGEDTPLVWISEGFTRLNGWARIEAIGRNCRFLQSDASDFAAIYEMRRAIAARVQSRVYVWNENLRSDGSWTLLSLIPGNGDVNDEQARGATMGAEAVGVDLDARCRYMAGVQYRLTKAEMRFVFERTTAYRMAQWERAPLRLSPTAQTSPVPSPLLAPASALPEVPILLGLSEPPPPKDPDGPASGPKAPKDSKLPTAAPPSELMAALAAWERDFARLHGAPPTQEDTLKLVQDARVKMSAEMPELG